MTEAEFETGLDAHRDRVDINAEPAPRTLLERAVYSMSMTTSGRSTVQRTDSLFDTELWLGGLASREMRCKLQVKRRG